MLLRRRAPGDAERAQPLLDQALDTYGDLGLTADRTRAEAILASIEACGGSITATLTIGCRAE